MTKFIIPVLCLFFLGCKNVNNTTNEEKKEITLKETLKDKFLIGTAMNLNQISGRDTLGIKVIKEQFSAIVAENCMKSMYLQPKEGEFNFTDADRFVAFGEKNNMFITGHTLVWHSQAPDWFFVDEKGKDVSREVLIERMKNHITTVVKHYKGAIKGWDVVNEAIMEDGSYRKSKFYEIIGEDFITMAFQFAHEADPEAELYYNDYNEWHAGKRDAIVKMVKSMKEKRIRIDCVGMQGHMGMDYPSLEEYEAAIEAYHGAGVKVMVTELDMSPLPSPSKNVGANISDTIAYEKEINPYIESLPENIQSEWQKRFVSFFALFLKHYDKISRVTMWGVSDRDSWKNDFPVKGRTDYPLLFDRQYKAKPIVSEIIKITEDLKK